MEELLRAVENLRKTEVRKSVDARMREFKNNCRKPSEKIFEELCFCILAANFNAERAMKIQEDIGKYFLTLSESKLAAKLRQLGYRFPATRAKYILKAREHIDSLKEIIESPDSSNELREWLVENVYGIGYKEASLPSYEKVLVIIDGKAEPVQIGELYRQYTNGDYNDRRLETFSFNPETLDFEIAPITNVLRHEYKKDLYEIQLEWGRRVSVTGDHSVFTVNNNGMAPIDARALRAGDFIAVPRRLPVLNTVEYEFNLVREFIKRNIVDNVYLKSKEYCNFLRENHKKEIIRKNQYVQYFRGIVPLRVVAGLPETAYTNDILKKFKVRISLRASPNTVDAIIRLDKDFFWILGLLIAEAALSRNPIEITLGIDEHERFVKLNKLLSGALGLEVREYYPKNRNVCISKINNLLFFYFIRDVLGIKGYSDSLSVPRVVFSTSFSNIVSFLQGYWEGDGWKRSESYFNVQTHSNELAEDLLLLLLMVGVAARACKKWPRGFKPAITNSIDYSGIIQPIQLENGIPVNRREVIPKTGKIMHEILRKLKTRTKIGGKQTSLYRKVMRWEHIGQPSRVRLKEFLIEVQKNGTCQEIETLKAMVDSDLSFARIRRIERISYGDKYVYDLEVAKEGKDFQNFIGGVGGVCLHNSHFLRNVGFTDFAILDFHIIDLLERCGSIERPKTLTKRKYLEIEEQLREIAAELELNLAELDLYLWYMETGKILK